MQPLLAPARAGRVAAPETPGSTRGQGAAALAAARGKVAAALAAAAGLLIVAAVWGRSAGVEPRLFLGSAIPFIGDLDPRAGWGVVPALAVAVVGVWLAPTAARRLPWRGALLAGWLGAAVWAVALAAADGVSRIAAPLARRSEALHDVPAVGADPVRFLRGFTDALPAYATHTQGHPPGGPLLLWLLDSVGLGGPVPAAVLVIAAGSSAAATAAITLRIVAGEAAARRALPFLVLAPAALWVATSMDALFLGVSTAGIALVALACARPDRDRAGDGIALLGGLTLGAGLFLTYNLVALGAVPLAAVAVLRRPRRLAVAALGVTVVAVGSAVAGFSWFAGVAATHVEWAAGVGPRRPYGYFLVADLAVLAVVCGPAAVAGFPQLRERGTALLVGAALLGVLASDLSGFSRGEVERVWLPFTPWLLVATAALPGRHRGWLAAQAGTALVLQTLVRSPW